MPHAGSLATFMVSLPRRQNTAGGPKMPQSSPNSGQGVTIRDLIRLRRWRRVTFDHVFTTARTQEPSLSERFNRSMRAPCPVAVNDDRRACPKRPSKPLTLWHLLCSPGGAPPSRYAADEARGQQALGQENAGRPRLRQGRPHVVVGAARADPVLVGGADGRQVSVRFREELLHSRTEGPVVLPSRTGIALAARPSALWRS